MGTLTQLTTATPTNAGVMSATAAGSTGKMSGTAAQNSLVATGKSGKSFTDVLGKTQSNDKDTQTDDANNGLAAMLQGLGFSPAFILAMLTLGQPSNGQSVSGGDSSHLDVQSITALQSLSGQSNLLNQLIGNEKFQQLLDKISNLLASMNLANAPGSASSAVLLISSTSNQQGLPKNAAEAKNIMDQFMNALSSHKDSLLFQQLAEDFQEIASPVIAENSAAAETQSTKASSNGSTAQDLLAKSGSSNVPFQQSAPIIAAPAPLKPSNQSDQQGMRQQTDQVAKSMSKLDVLMAKSATNNPLMQAIADTVHGDQGKTSQDPLAMANNAVTPTNLLQFTRGLQLVSAQPTTAQSFVQDMSKFILSNFKVSSLNGFSQATLTLSPANLGQVDVKLTMQNGQLAAQFSAQTLLGKEMLAGQLSELRQSLLNQGLQVDKLEVTQNSSLQSSLFHDQRQQPFSQQFAQQFMSPAKSIYGDSDTVEANFTAQMANVARTQSIYRNGFDVTA